MKERAIEFADPRWTFGANVRRLSALAEIGREFERRGIRVVAIKGAALLLTVYRQDLGKRPMGDLDLVVAPGGDLERAIGALANLGYQEVPGRGRDFVRTQGDLSRVDLQTSLWHLDREGFAEWLARCRRADAGGATILVPDPVDHVALVLIHSAIRHAELRPAWIEDAARLAPAAALPGAQERIIAAIRGVRGEVPVGIWLDLASERIGRPIVPAPFRARLGDPARRPLLAWIYRKILARSRALPELGELATHLFHHPGPRRWERIVRYVFPDRETLLRRYESRDDSLARLRLFRLADLARRGTRLACALAISS